MVGGLGRLIVVACQGFLCFAHETHSEKVLFWFWNSG